MILDDGLVMQDEIWFEAGDHRSLVEGDQFRQLPGPAPHGVFSAHN
ncbi:MAG: hypothetical protein ACR2Q4_15595 [Geminicoccaceae bacterium]